MPPASARRLQLLRLMVGDQAVDERRELAVDDTIEIVQRQVDAMVGHAPLWEVVGADALGAVTRTDHAAPALRFGGLLLGLRAFEQAGAQNLQRLGLVLVLRLL